MNTEYTIHPEEISADNFVIWTTKIDNLNTVESPAVVSRMNEIITHAENNA